jgi:hypothetical protein
VQYITTYLCLVPVVGLDDVFTLSPVCLPIIFMDNTLNWLMDWVVLDWNVRGLNDKDKRLVVHNKIEESNCAVICLQETKCESFDHSFIRSFCPKRFDRFAFSPSIGASGGLIVLWNSSIFTGTILEIHRSAI